MKHAFSLVELSIVLVILGLLTGGILTGQSLIRAAELRSVSTEASNYTTATYTFRDKYFALPGDMPNAGSFWGYPANNATNCPATAGTGTQTCDGDRNGRILPASAASRYGETFTFWQHLANAGLIEGTYTGIAGSAGTGNDHIIGVNTPAGKISNSGWTASYGAQSDDAPNEYDIGRDYGNTLMFGSKFPVEATGGANLTPEEAWNIDTKMDDGLPAQGNVIARYWNDLCGTADDGTSTDDDLNASYNLSVTTTECSLHFLVGF